jgi:hypothetical protein
MTNLEGKFLVVDAMAGCFLKKSRRATRRWTRDLEEAAAFDSYEEAYSAARVNDGEPFGPLSKADLAASTWKLFASVMTIADLIEFVRAVKTRGDGELARRATQILARLERRRVRARRERRAR